MSNWTSDLNAYIAPDPRRSALVLIDTQVDFLDGGASPIPGTTQVRPKHRPAPDCAAQAGSHTGFS